MKNLVMGEFADFECIGDRCPDTCCAGWKVSIDHESAERYLAEDGEFGDRLRDSIHTDEKGNHAFVMTKEMRCPFLNKENLCQIYRTLGPDALCRTCQDFPRITYSAGDILFMALSISCPEAGRMILEKKEKAQYIFFEKNEYIMGEDTDWDKFNTAIRTYTTIQSVLQERQFYLRERLASTLVYVFQTNELSAAGCETDTLTQLFMDPDQYASVVASVLSPSRNMASKFKFIRLLLNIVLKKSPVKSLFDELQNAVSFVSDTDGNVIELWENGFEEFDRNVDEVEQEQLLVYLLFRHFMENYQKRTVWDSVALMVIFYSVYRSLTVLHYLSSNEFPDFNWRTLTVARISRLFEHSNEVWGSIYDGLCKEEDNQLKFFLNLVN